MEWVSPQQQTCESTSHYYRDNPKLQTIAIEQFIEEPYAYGLDREHGGLFYFLDVGGHSPTQLEWGMKLWWVHCETMVASLLAYQYTREARHWQMFHEICQYTLSKVRERCPIKREKEEKKQLKLGCIAWDSGMAR